MWVLANAIQKLARYRDVTSKSIIDCCDCYILFNRRSGRIPGCLNDVAQVYSSSCFWKQKDLKHTFKNKQHLARLNCNSSSFYLACSRLISVTCLHRALNTCDWTKQEQEFFHGIVLQSCLSACCVLPVSFFFTSLTWWDLN